MKKFMNEFKEFIARGNVLDMAVGIIIGGAFTAIVNSLVNDILGGLLGIILGGVKLSELKTVVDGLPWGDPEMPPTFYWGNFISAVITFFLTALVLFLLLKGINKARSLGKKKTEEAPAAPTTKICPFCMSEIDIKATRCPHCTSQLEEEK